jgi:hypothetical protein
MVTLSSDNDGEPRNPKLGLSGRCASSLDLAVDHGTEHVFHGTITKVVEVFGSQTGSRWIDGAIPTLVEYGLPPRRG